MLPRLPDAVILMCFIMLPKVLRPSGTLFSNAVRSFVSRMMPALSLAMSTAGSTETPTAAWQRRRVADAVAHIPNCMPAALQGLHRPLLLSGREFGEQAAALRRGAHVCSSMASASRPVRPCAVSTPTLVATPSLSTVSATARTPCPRSAEMAGRALCLGGPKKPAYPMRTMALSSATLNTPMPVPRFCGRRRSSAGRRRCGAHGRRARAAACSPGAPALFGRQPGLRSAQLRVCDLQGRAKGASPKRVQNPPRRASG